MKVEEPTFAYELPNSRMEELRNRLIASIRELTDIQLLTKCEELLKIGSHKAEVADDEQFKESVRGAFKEYKDYLKGKHKLKSEEEFWDELYKD
jgi:hypothetical protein